MADDVQPLTVATVAHPDRDHAVGIDVGSTNVKVVLLDGNCRQMAAASRPLTWDRHGPVAEQDAEVLWQAVLDAVADLGRASRAGGGVGLGRVGTIGVCGQYSSIVPVDVAGRPLAPMRLYLDQRGTGHCLAIMERHPEAFGCWVERHPVPPVGGGLALGHLLGFQHDEPDVHRDTASYLEPVDYVTARLTGVIAATQGSQFAGQLIDNRSLGVTEYDADLVEMAGVDASRLPPLVAPDAVLGAVRADVAERTGLPRAAAVRAGMTDSQAAALATGVAPSSGPVDVGGRLGIAIGTTSVVLAATERMTADFTHEVLSMPGVSTERWLVWAENGLAGRAVEAVMTRLVHARDVLGDHRGSGPLGAFEGFDEALAASPPGARGLRFLPWLSGSMSPQADASMRGGFVGMSLDTERVDLVRAAAEGVAHNLRWLLAPVEAVTGEPCRELVLIGGASASPGWCQTIADVLGRSVRTVTDAGHAGARAVAAWAADPDRATDEGSQGNDDGPSPGLSWDRSFEPDPRHEPVHAAAHLQFVAAFEALRPLGLGAAPPA